MIIELDNYVDAKSVEHIRSRIESCISSDGKPNEYNRQGTTVSISHIKDLEDVTLQLTMIFRSVKRDIRPTYKPSYSGMSDTGYEFHRYYPGDVCAEHADSEIVAGQPNLRYASAVLHLNTLDEGGELVFPAQNKQVKTQAGKVVVFPPYGMYSHYTTPSTQARDVIVTWFTYDGLSVVKNGINITSNQGL